MAKYKGIEFAEGYNKSFANFKKEFSSTHVFKDIPEPQKELELEKAYLIAYTHGNIVTTPKQRKKTKSAKSDDTSI